MPVAVLDSRVGGGWSTARRLSLRYAVIPDSRQAIASQFNLLNPADLRATPAWFVVDRRGTVRGLCRGELPAGGYSKLAATALAIPAPDVTVPTQSR
jgi:alkyl hydroperoxide reductase subunit AhpC